MVGLYLCERKHSSWEGNGGELHLGRSEIYLGGITVFSYQVGCPFPGSSQDLRGILRMLSYFSKGIYEVGCPFLESSWENGKVSLES